MKTTHEKHGKLLGRGAQFSVYETSDPNRVVKIPNTTTEAATLIRRWKVNKDESARIIERTRLQRQINIRQIKPVLLKFPELRILLGNPNFIGPQRFTQDKAVPISNLMDDEMSEIRAMELIDKYTHLSLELWRYGIHEKIFNFTINNGLNADGRLILFDFGEISFEKDDAKNDIVGERWVKSWSARQLTSSLRDYLFAQMQLSLTETALDRTWKSANQS